MCLLIHTQSITPALLCQTKRFAVVLLCTELSSKMRFVANYLRLLTRGGDWSSYSLYRDSRSDGRREHHLPRRLQVARQAQSAWQINKEHSGYRYSTKRRIFHKRLEPWASNSRFFLWRYRDYSLVSVYWTFCSVAYPCRLVKFCSDEDILIYLRQCYSLSWRHNPIERRWSLWWAFSCRLSSVWRPALSAHTFTTSSSSK